MSWNFADVWEAVADRFPDSPAVVVASGSSTSWREFDADADGVARAYLDAGLERQSKVAQYLRNGPEYLESVFACFKAGLVPVNTNYRYTDRELADLWADADVEAVVFHGSFTARCEEVRDRVDGIRLWLWVDDGEGECPPWAVAYRDAAESGRCCGPVLAPWGRSGEDLLLLYTGGTTGRPKGVMWHQDTLVRMLEELNGRSVAADADAVLHASMLESPGPKVLPAPPLMHGTALFFVLPVLSQGGCIVCLDDRRFDPSRLLDAIESANVKGLCLVGDAFARPIVDAIDAHPGRWDLSSLRVVLSSGVMFSEATKSQMLAHMANATIVDSLGSSETGSVARSMATAGGNATPETASFRVGPRTRVIDDDDRDIEPGSGQAGRVVVSGHIPAGYYGDPSGTATTFVLLDGARHVITGDWAEVDAGGGIRLLGRGSICINTGGEKVFPEEVEEAIKSVDGVLDAVVVGVPDERLGEVVAAIVEPTGASAIDTARVLDEVRKNLAGYKVPRHVVVAPVGRAVNGKADYSGLRDLVRSTVGG